MPAHLLLQLLYLLRCQRQRRFVPFRQLLHPLGERLTDPVHLAMNGGADRCQPFIIHHQRLDLGLAQFGIFPVGQRIQGRLGFFQGFFEVALLGTEFQPGVENCGLFLGCLVPLDLFQASRDIGLVHLVQLGKRSLLAAMFLFHLGQLGTHPFKLSLQIAKSRLLRGKVAINDELLGNQIAAPPPVFLLPLLVLLDDAGRLGFPAIGGDEVAIVLHGGGPVIHEVLVDIVLVYERLAGVMGEKLFRKFHDDALGMTVNLQPLEALAAPLSPVVEQGIHVLYERDELGMLVDGRLDGLLGYGQIKEADPHPRTLSLRARGEECLPQLRADFPVRLQGIQIGDGNPTLHMSFDVLNILGLLTVDVAGDIEVEVVLLDLIHPHHAGVLGDLQPLVEDIDDLMNVAVTETVLVAVLEIAAAGVHHEDTFSGMGVLLVDDDDAGGNAGAVEEVSRETDDPLDIPLQDEILPDLRFGIAAKEDAVGKNAGAFAGGFEGTDDVEQIGVISLLVRGRSELLESLIGVIGYIHPGAPPLVAEGRIGHHVVEGFELAMIADKERIRQGVPLSDEGRGVVVQDHIHPGQAGGGGVLLLTVEGDLGSGFIPHFQQQRSRAAGRIIHRGAVRRRRFMDADDLRHDSTDLGGGIELSFALAALGGEVAHEVFVGIPQDVVTLGAVLAKIQRPVFKDTDEVGEPLHLLHAAPHLAGVVKVRHVRQLVGIGQRTDNLLVDLIADVGLPLEGNHILETGTFGDGDRRIGDTGILIGDVFDEQQDQHVVFILRGIHPPTQLVAGLPEGRVEFGFFDRHELILVVRCEGNS